MYFFLLHLEDKSHTTSDDGTDNTSVDEVSGSTGFRASWVSSASTVGAIATSGRVTARGTVRGRRVASSSDGGNEGSEDNSSLELHCC